jgi:NTE family protein
MLSRMFSPYQINPLNYNPLRSILDQVVDFEGLRRRCTIKLFLCATNVQTGKVRIFTNDEICLAHVLASACLPNFSQAVEIDGEYFWDGGYMGNPALFPLIYGCQSRDIIVVHINPTERPELPRTAQDIINRINEISFNSSLFREMRAIAFVSRLVDEGKITDGSLKRMLIHAIEADDVMQGLGPMSKLNADWDFLMHLHDIGRERADRRHRARARRPLAQVQSRPARGRIDRRYPRQIFVRRHLRSESTNEPHTPAQDAAAISV